MLTAAAVDGVFLKLTYSEALDEMSKPAKSAYLVTAEGSAKTVSGVAVNGSEVTLTLEAPVEPGQVIRVSYMVPTTNPVQDSGGAGAASLYNQAVTNSSVLPTLSSATVNGTTLVLTYSEALDTNSVPAASEFTVEVAGSTAALANTDPVDVSGSAVTLTLASAVTVGQGVELDYTAGTNPIRDAAGNQAADLSDETVTNTVAPTSAR